MASYFVAMDASTFVSAGLVMFLLGVVAGVWFTARIYGQSRPWVADNRRLGELVRSLRHDLGESQDKVQELEDHAHMLVTDDKYLMRHRWLDKRVDSELASNYRVDLEA